MYVNVKYLKPVLIIFVIVLSAATTLYGSVYYVNDTSTVGDVYTSATGNDANAGTSSAPFATIGKAMTVVHQGDTVYVDAGTYSETVVISVNVLSLIGADTVNTIINAGSTSYGNYAISASNRTNLVIKDLEVTNGYIGISFDRVDSSLVKNVYSTDNEREGIVLYYSNNNKLNNNTVTSNPYGGFILDSSKHNILSNNTVRDNSIGFKLMGSSNNTLRNNKSSDNSSGFWLQGAYNNTLTSNTVRYSDISGFNLIGSNSNTFINNTSSNNYYGFFVSRSSDYNTIKSNVIKNNSKSGIYIDAKSNGNTVTNNKLSNNGSYSRQRRVYN